jgi:hypothetical protein
VQEFGEHLFLVPITLSDSVESWLRQFILPFIDDLQMCMVGPSNVARPGRAAEGFHGGATSIQRPSRSARCSWR